MGLSSIHCKSFKMKILNDSFAPVLPQNYVGYMPVSWDDNLPKIYLKKNNEVVIDLQLMTAVIRIMI